MTPEKELEVEVLDIQHDTDPADDHGPAKRIPHMGHTVLFFALTVMAILSCAAVFFAVTHLRTDDDVKAHPGVGYLAQAAAYIVTLAISFQLFPRLWERSFLHGIQWNVLAAHRRWFWVVPAGIVLSIATQLAELHMKTPENPDLVKVLSTRTGVWLLSLYGVLLAPLIEEVAFRGFLLPALATAYDWLSLERTRAALRRWEMTSGHSKGAVVFGALFSTAAFALIHAPQLKFSWGPVAVIFAAGLAFAIARIRTHSVACSTLMHAAYNFTIFAWMFIDTGGFRHLDKITK